MSMSEERSSRSSALRKRAEEVLASSPVKFASYKRADIRTIIHELNVYQIELEMQNEELRLTQFELHEAWTKYADLYDFAPVGYFIFDRKGIIVQANLTGARFIGVTRDNLIDNRLKFPEPEDGDTFHLHLNQVSKGNAHTCELKLMRDDGSSFDARLESYTDQGKRDG